MQAHDGVFVLAVAIALPAMVLLRTSGRKFGVRAWRMLALLTSLAPAGAHAATSYSSVYAFGDSYADGGSYSFRARSQGGSDPTPESVGYRYGRFTNGYTFVDDLARHYTGAVSTSYLEGGTNYAFGAALARTQVGVSEPYFRQQVDTFLASGRSIANDALVVVTFGTNDINSLWYAPDPIDFTASSAALRSGLIDLIGAGARHIVVTGAPDLGATEESRTHAEWAGDPANVARDTARSIALNKLFEGVSAELDGTTGADVAFFDLLAFNRQLIANPTNYGLDAGLTATGSCVKAGKDAVEAGCDGYLFFDQIHLTADVHQAMATEISTRLASASASAVPEPEAWGMMMLGFGMVAGAVRTRRAPRGVQSFT